MKKKTKDNIMGIGAFMMFIGVLGIFEEVFRIASSLGSHTSVIPLFIFGGIFLIGTIMFATIDAINSVDDPGNFPDWWGA